jgi:hypothetical protein
MYLKYYLKYFKVSVSVSVFEIHFKVSVPNTGHKVMIRTRTAL